MPQPKSSSVVCSLHSSTDHVRPKTLLATWLDQYLRDSRRWYLLTNFSSDSMILSSCPSVSMMQCCSATRQTRTASSRSLSVRTLSTRSSCASSIISVGLRWFCSHAEVTEMSNTSRGYCRCCLIGSDELAGVRGRAKFSVTLTDRLPLISR